ncbi:hypothetical protein BaRGS_00005201 [Batillaria attramentaria]|uniref:G2 and S phase-expressed protein 1 N-terminal domain-containing protein n=1 Tax=Batillaria attramentaria TaxID=370345 RepID=A0ABD0LWC4_9CAEN
MRTKKHLALNRRFSSSPVSDSIEITRRDSQTLSEPLDFEDRVFRDVTDKSIGSQGTGKAVSPDVRLIDEEEFDFDLPVSPSERHSGAEKADEEDDEEVFFGPVGFTEKCIAAGVAEEAIKPLSPLRPDQIAELAKEAFSVAHRISNMKEALPAQSQTPQPVLKPKHLASLFKDAKKPAFTSDQNTSEDTDKSHNNNTDSSRSADISGIQEFSSSTENIPPPSPGKRPRSGTFTKEEPVESLLQESGACSGGKTAGKRKSELNSAAGKQKPVSQTSRLQAPTSRLTRFNKSKSNLIKENVQDSGAAKPGPGSKEPIGTAVTSTIPGSRKSLQLPKAGGGLRTERQRSGSGDSDKSLPETSSKSRTGLPKPSVRRTQSMNVKSGLPMRGSKMAAPSQKLVLKSQNQQTAQADTNTTAPSGIPKGPATKPQLLQPSQLQRRSLAFGRGRGNPAPQTGPLKVPAQPAPKLGDTVERPYNPLLAVGPNAQCPSTPACGEKVSQPKKLSTTVEISTPAKSSSPLSLASSTTSSVSRRSVVSSSDAADSPVFGQNGASKLPRNRRVSGSKESCTSSDLDGHGCSPFPFKPRKPLVQNTPDLPTRTLSRWSPLRRPKPVPLEDQVSMCTKRTSSK